MFDPNPLPMQFHLKDLERQLRPTLKDYRPKVASTGLSVRIISVVAALVALAIIVPMA